MARDYYDDDEGPGFLGTALWLTVAAGGLYFIYRAVTGSTQAAGGAGVLSPRITAPLTSLEDLLATGTAAPAAATSPVASTSASTSGLPLGIQNNNPGNIAYTAANQWQGQVGQDSHGFVIFDTPANGLRAMFKLLKSYQANIQGAGGIGVFNIESISRQWTQTQQDAWASNVSAASGFGLYDQLDAGNQAQMETLANGIIVAENGSAYSGYYAGTLDTAWAMAA
jgi:hypothetical protein